ncbi:PAS domain S-box protein [archaeon]|nr:MAG: PAS domain S-box protein [archaeon]
MQMRKPHARVKYANPAFSSITGYSLKDVMGKSWSFLKVRAAAATTAATARVAT